MIDENIDIKAAIDTHIDVIAESATNRLVELNLDCVTRFGDMGRVKCIQDIKYHLSYLSNSISVSSPILFTEYIAWARILLSGFGITDEFSVSLAVLNDIIRETLPKRMADVCSEYLEDGIHVANFGSPQHVPLSTIEQHLCDPARAYLDALLNWDHNKASKIVFNMVDDGATFREVCLDIFAPVQYDTGRLWQLRKISVAHEHYITAATQSIMSQLYPRLIGSICQDRISEKLKQRGAIVASCVTGELHELGIRMVANFMEIYGWDTRYLGSNVPIAGIVSLVKEINIPLIMISATLTTNLSTLVEWVIAIRSANPNIKIMVGGYPFNVDKNLWHRIGADGYAPNADEAVVVANRLCT